ncbi:MAG TPA: GNAT family protein [Phenylobacterium sp.]|nr:GNAT family protein [Phenylobacterium sp.]
MALLDWIAPESGLRVEGAGIYLRPPRASDYPEWRELRAVSRGFLQPWEPTWPADDLGRAAYRRRLTAYARDRDAGAAYPFFVFRESDGALTGGITLSNVRRGVAQMGSVGYWCGRPFTRQGHTLAAVRALTEFAFRTLALHRLEAACGSRVRACTCGRRAPRTMPSGASCAPPAAPSCSRGSPPGRRTTCRAPPSAAGSWPTPAIERPARPTPSS